MNERTKIFDASPPAFAGGAHQKGINYLTINRSIKWTLSPSTLMKYTPE
jgi:hypothetical protein